LISKKSGPMMASENQANKICEGIYNRNFKDWYCLNGNYYAPIGDVAGLEIKRNKVYFHNFIDNNIYLVRFVEFATLDERTYFIHLVLKDKELFIPIR